MNGSANKRLPSIRRYLLSRILGILLVSFLVFVGTAYLVVVRPAQEELARLEMSRVATEVEGDISALINQMERVLGTGREWGRSGLLHLDQPQDFAALMIPIVRIRPQMSAVLLADERGRGLQLNRAPEGWVVRETDVAKLGPQQHFMQFNDDAGYVGEKWVTTGYDARTRPWYKGALELKNDDEVFWTAPYSFFARQDVGMTAAMRWTDRNSGERWVIGFDVLLLDLSRFTSKIEVGTHGRAAVLSADGKLVGLPRAKVNRSASELEAQLFKTPGEAGLPILAAAYDEWIAAGRPEARTDHFSYAGEDWIARFRPVALRNQSLVIATYAPRSDFAVGTAWNAAAIGAVMLFVLALGLLIGRRFSRRLAGVVEQLVNESERIGALQLDAPVDIPVRVRELARLVGAQERMRTMLLDATRNLESQVRSRTQALTDERALLQNILDKSPVSIAITSKGVIRFVNPIVKDKFGFQVGDWAPDVYVRESDRDALIAILKRDGIVQNQEVQMWSKDRRKLDMLVSFLPIPYEGEPGILAWLVDITERKKTERELAEALERQNAIFAASPHGIAVFEERRLVVSSPSFERVFGYAPGEAVGLSSRALFESDEEFERIGRLVYDAAKRGEASSYETRTVRKDGSSFWCRVTAAPLAGREAVRGVVGLYEDVSARKAAEEALQAAYAQQEAIFESTTVGIAFIRERTIENCNHRLEQIFGYGPREFVGKTTRVWYRSDEEHHRGGNAVYEQLARGETHRREQELVRKDGSLFWCRLTGRAVDADHPGKGSVWILEDVTDERAAADALRDAKRAAEDATKAKSMFLASMSHEIRTPMNGVLGMLEVLGLTNLDSEQRGALEVVRDSAKSLLRIIDDVLDFSKIEAGRLVIRPEATSVAAVIEGVFGVYANVASTKGLLLRRRTDAGISPALLVDPLRLRQILNNFVSNAIKFTSKGSVDIEADLVRRDPDGRDLVRFSVTDTGIGVSKEAQDRLFRPYTQAEQDTTRRFGGTGLGLTICRQLADLMRGRIVMQSEPGKGTTMILELSLPLADAKDLPKPGSSGASGAALVASRRTAPSVEAAEKDGSLVLVAEDHPTNRTLITRQLNLLGYGVMTASNGVEALEKWGAKRFGIVVTDCNMPEMDGFDLARAIRARESAGELRRTPIIACTANAFADEAQQCVAAGMDDFVAKPVELEALARVMDRWLPLAGSPRGQPPSARPETAAADDVPLDRASLAQLTGGDAAVEREILVDFRKSNDADMASLRSALAKHDTAELIQASHRLKGACRSVGATALAAVCERIERAGRQSRWNDIASEQNSLEREFERLNRWLVKAG
ncbi:MAG TPA: PAS domain S-box protein [Burkholderiales bacterium]|nr:PAS domain S-box protein [Burkholderiales bacterium]